MLMLAFTALGVSRLTFDGAFTSSAASAIVTSSTRTALWSGTLLFNNIGLSGGTGADYSKNGGAWTAVTEGGTLAITAGDTLALRGAVGITPGNTVQFDLRNNANSALTEQVVFTRL